jgi:CheY-like chemotaxis protein
MESLGTLAGGIAHDFNNILGAIYGFAALLGDDNANKADDQRFVQRIRSACERGRDLIAQIRTFSLAEGAEREVVDMVRIVRQSSDMLLASFPISTRLRFNYADEQLPILGSDALLGQLIANLCINASEALDGNPGEVIVDIGRATSSDLKPLRAKAAISGERLIGEIAPSNDYAVLRISDTAGGISDAVLDRMFEPFFTTKGRQRGTGLGLAVVHGVIKSHGGACHVTTVPGKGTTFSIYLPLQQGRVAQPKAGQPAADLHGGERLLIVDDEPDIVDMLSIGLERLGYETVGVTDPFEALAAFEENPEAWDTVITDQVMPQMSGVELVRKLKTVRPAIKVVLCTGYGEKAEESFSADWIDALVRKPADAAIIASKLRKLIDSRVVP